MSVALSMIASHGGTAVGTASGMPVERHFQVTTNHCQCHGSATGMAALAVPVIAFASVPVRVCPLCVCFQGVPTINTASVHVCVPVQ